MSSIVDKAKGVVIERKGKPSGVTADQIELAVAWLAGEVTWTQAATALNIDVKKSGYGYFGPALREAYRRGILVRSKAA